MEPQSNYFTSVPKFVQTVPVPYSPPQMQMILQNLMDVPVKSLANVTLISL